MAKGRLKYFLSFILALHCLGVTQLASAVAKDKTVFVGMLSINEEETKKEKEGKGCFDFVKGIQDSPTLNLFALNCMLYSEFKHKVYEPFVIESPAPPPDFTV